MKTDLNYLKTMSGNSIELISEMIQIFNDQVIEFSVEMQELHDRQDFSSLSKLAHKAKTSVSIMGMHVLSEKLKELEVSARDSKNTESYQEIIDFFKSECDQAVMELKDFQDQLSKPRSHVKNRK